MGRIRHIQSLEMIKNQLEWSKIEIVKLELMIKEMERLGIESTGELNFEEHKALNERIEQAMCEIEE